MARSPAHQFGQIVGEVLEAAVGPLLEEFARTHNLYLDKAGDRACRRGRKCSLAATVLRQIDRVLILALHGHLHKATSVEDAILFLEAYDDDGRAKPLERYEIEIRYNNGDSIRGNFHDKHGAVAFLRDFLPVTPTAG